MSKHTPGPYYGANAMDGRPKIFKAHSDGGAIFVTRFNSASQRDEVVNLLNKGTHFDDMLEALKALVDFIGPIRETKFAAYEDAHAVIAKAEGRK